jgi:GTP:adenosylcobinamide-phosphate guanylyltransferase
VGEEELDRFDPERLSFFNINTEADLKRARTLAAQETTQRKSRK